MYGAVNISTEKNVKSSKVGPKCMEEAKKTGKERRYSCMGVRDREGWLVVGMRSGWHGRCRRTTLDGRRKVDPVGACADTESVTEPG